MPVVVGPPRAVEQSALEVAPPLWVSQRGGDCRAYDRRSMREVYGPAHPFAKPTDCVLTNGIIRFRVGNRGAPPALHVQALVNGTWPEIGVVQVADDQLLGARLAKVTPDLATVALVVRDQDPIYVSLARGERMLRIDGGPLARWLGMPPTTVLSDPQSADGRFGKGVTASAGSPSAIRFAWPADQASDNWTVAVQWLPTAASGSQPLSGLLALTDSVPSQAGGIWWDSADRKVKFQLGSTIVASPALTFVAGTPIFVRASLSPSAGMSLTVKVDGNAPTHAHDTSHVDPGTVFGYAELRMGWSDGTPWGSGTWGEGYWGGWRLPEGVLDNLMLFEDALSDTEAAVLAGATYALDALPQPEGRLVLYAPWDPAPIPTAGALTTGTIADSAADADGLTRAVAALSGAITVIGLGLSAWDASFAALVATAADTVAAQHAQFAATSEQQLRVR